MIPLLLHTPGEPAGVGPELLVRLAQHASDDCRVAVACPDLLERTAHHLKLPLRLRPRPSEPCATQAGQLWLEPIAGAQPVAFGQANPANANYLLDCLRRATELAGQAHAALITGPLSKACINQAGIAFSGHTEFLAELCGNAYPVMMLANAHLRVALATTHMPLSAVPEALTADTLRRCLRILDESLSQRFGIASPRIMVCGLNPHAGESGHLGREELEVIEPVIRELDDGSQRIFGPVPADTAFTPPRLAACDAVLTMYHDQGLPVLKHIGFENAVNITLGLPIIRTSVDHGTAFDIAGQGIAHLGSLKAAEQLAAELAKNGT